MSNSVKNKVVLITGAARGIGAEVARMLARRGARLSLVGMEAKLLESLAQELGAGHVWFECDVTQQKQIDAAVEGTVKHFGAIDIVVANAGIACNGTISITPVEDLIRVIDVNLSGVVRTVSATLPFVTQSQGYYLLISSAAALKSMPVNSTYGASKIAVEQFGNSLRMETAYKGVHVGVAHPAWVSTDLVKDQQADLTSFNEMLRKMPWPFSSMTTVEVCAAAFVDAIEHRRRNVYVPKALAVIAGVRQVFMGRAWEYIIGRQARHSIPKLEIEIKALGRSFGRHSAGRTDHIKD
jgi:short-subunit dehydrogenase